MWATSGAGLSMPLRSLRASPTPCCVGARHAHARPTVRVNSTPDDPKGLPGGAPSISREAILDSIAKAKQYKTQSTPPPSPSPDEGVPPSPGLSPPLAGPTPPTPPGSPRTPPTAPQPPQSAPLPLDPMAQPSTTNPQQPAGPSGKVNSTNSTNPVPFAQRPTEGTTTEGLTDMIRSNPQRPGGGNANEAAEYLQGVFNPESGAAQGMDPNMRPEVFSAMRQENVRRMGAEIITVDQNYDAGGSINPVLAPGVDSSKEDVSYRPTVSTWGVFPRPNNISKAYGGGRTIVPGQDLETQEQKDAREAEFRASMAMYKKKMGLELDPKLEEDAMVLVEEGMVFFKVGELMPAYEKFDAASKLVPIRTKPGGLAALQKAIILDSVGRSDEAKKLYQQCSGHALTSVSKKSKQMMFGFKASDFLKADTINLRTSNKEYVKYFRTFADKSKIYIPTEEERQRDEEQARISALIALAVLLGPLVLFAAVATKNPSPLL